MRHTLLPLMAQLMLKNHHEFNELFQNRPVAASLLHPPMAVDFKLGSASTSMTFTQPGNVLNLTFKEGVKHFAVLVALDPQDRQVPKVEVFWRDGSVLDAPLNHKVISSSDFLNWQAPAEFKDLHARVVTHLKTLVPAALRKAFGLDKEPAASNLSTTATAQAAADATGVDVADVADSANSQEAQLAQASAASDASESAPAEQAHEDGFRRYEVRRDNQPDLHFEGRLIAQVASLPRQGRQYVLQVFETRSGKIVALRSGRSLWLGERDRVEARVLGSTAELPEFFGYGVLAKHLYAQLDVNAAETIE